MSRNCSCEFSDNPCSSCLIANRDELIVTLQKNNDTLNTDLKEAEGAVADLMALNDTLTAEVEKLSGRLRRRGRKYEKLSKERDRFRGALEKIQQHSIETDQLYNESAQALLGREPRDGAVTIICTEALNHKEK